MPGSMKGEGEFPGLSVLGHIHSQLPAGSTAETDMGLVVWSEGRSKAKPEKLEDSSWVSAGNRGSFSVTQAVPLPVLSLEQKQPCFNMLRKSV